MLPSHLRRRFLLPLCAPLLHRIFGVDVPQRTTALAPAFSSQFSVLPETILLTTVSFVFTQLLPSQMLPLNLRLQFLDSVSSFFIQRTHYHLVYYINLHLLVVFFHQSSCTPWEEHACICPFPSPQDSQSLLPQHVCAVSVGWMDRGWVCGWGKSQGEML